MLHVESDRIRAHTAPEVQRRIDDRLRQQLAEAVDAPAFDVDRRLQAGEREWDVERVVEVEAPLMAGIGLALGALADKRFLALPAFVAGAVLLHAVKGPYPLLPLFRRLGLRSAREIQRERYALKALRGDFSQAGDAEASRQAALAGPQDFGDRDEALPPTTWRVARHTPDAAARANRERLEGELLRLAGEARPDHAARLAQLEREWDIERALQANASTLVLVGTALGATVSRKFLLLPMAVVGFLVQHALSGWCPPLPVLRRLGVRTTAEIEQERHAIKALRGDFEGLAQPGGATAADRAQRVAQVLRAIDA